MSREGGSAGRFSGTVAAARIGIAEKRRLDEMRQRFWDESAAKLNKLLEIAGFADKARIESLISAINKDRAAAQGGEIRFSADQYAAMRRSCDAAVESLEKSLEAKNVSLRQFNALRKSKTAPNIYDEEITMGAFHRGHAEAVKGSPRKAAVGLPSRSDGVVITPEGDEAQRRGMTYQAAQDRKGVMRDLKNIESIIDTGRPLTAAQIEEYDVKQKGRVESGLDAGLENLLSFAGRQGRWIGSTSGPDDSWRYRKFLESKDDHLRQLTNELKMGGMATKIMDVVEEQFENIGYLDDEGAARVSEMLKEVRDGDEQGVTDEILEEFNRINKAAVKKAQDHVDNEDSMSTIRIIQALLIASVFVGLPLLGPIVGAFAGSILGGGLAAGTPALMTHAAWGPLGSLTDVLFFDDFVGLILSETPILSEVIGVLDYVLLSGPGQIVGSHITAALAAPITPLAGAALFALYAKGRKGYNEKKDSVESAFEGFEKDMDELVMKYSGTDIMEKGKNPLSDDGFRKGFIEKKRDFVRDSSKIEALGDFVNAVNSYCQMNYSPQEGDRALSGIISPEMVRFLRENGMKDLTQVSDSEKVKKVVSKLFYEAKEDGQKKAFLDKLINGAGLFSYAAETSSDLEMGAVMGSVFDIIEGGENVAGKSKMGLEIFDAKSTLLYAKGNAVKVDEELMGSDFSGKSDEEIGQMVGKLKAAAGRAEEEAVQKEDALIKRMIKDKVVDKGLMEDFNKSPGTSPQGGSKAKRLLEMDPVQVGG